MNTYSVKEASEITGIPTRTVHYICKRDNVRKVSNKYQITDELISLWIDNKNDSSQHSSQSTATLRRDEENAKLSQENIILRLQIDSLETQQDLELEVLRNENESLKNELRSKDSNRIIKLIQEIDNDDYVISLLTAIKDEKHLEAMTDEEYSMFVDKLKEANSLAIRVEEYKKEIERMEGYVLDYRNNIEYFKKSLDKRQEETEILLNTIHQRNYIEAKEKGFDDDGELL